MKVVVTGGAGLHRRQPVPRRCWRPGVDEVVVLDDLSTGSRDNLDGVDVDLVEGTILDRDALDARLRRRRRRRPPGRPAVGAAIARRPDGQPHGQRHRHRRGARGGPPRRRPAGGGGLVVVGLRRQPDPAQARGPGHGARSAPTPPASWPPRPTPWPGTTPSACPCWPSASSTCSARCSRRATPTPRWCPAFVVGRAGGRAALPVHGDGRQSRDFTYVGTVAVGAHRRGHSTASAIAEPVNLAFGTRTDLLELIALLEEVVGHPLAVDHVEPRRRRRAPLPGRRLAPGRAVPRGRAGGRCERGPPGDRRVDGRAATDAVSRRHRRAGPTGASGLVDLVLLALVAVPGRCWWPCRAPWRCGSPRPGPILFRQTAGRAGRPALRDGQVPHDGGRATTRSSPTPTASPRSVGGCGAPRSTSCPTCSTWRGAR